MDGFPQTLQDCIFDNYQRYGELCFTFPHLSESDLKNILSKFNNDNQTYPIVCIWSPIVSKNQEFNQSGHIAIPTIFQGIPGKYEVYEEPATDSYLMPYLDMFTAAFKETAVQELYSRSDLNKIYKRLKECRNNVNDLPIKVGCLVKLNANTVEYAKQYPIARVTQNLKKQIDGLNCKIIHQKLQNNKVINMNGTGGWVNRNDDISEVLSESKNRIEHLCAYSQQIIKAQNIRHKQSKAKHKQTKNLSYSSYRNIMEDYFGRKIKMELKEENHKNNKKKRFSACAEQDIALNDIETHLIRDLKTHKIKYSDSNNVLIVFVNSPKQMGAIIGGQNIMNEKNGKEYFIKYPTKVLYGKKWVYPRLKIEFDVLGRNHASNIERS